MTGRVDLHNHTRYSNLRLRDALATPEQLIDRAIELGLSGIAITDHETVAGHIKANQYAQKIAETSPDFKVILGNEIYLVDERPSEKHWHFILIAKDAEGHHQLRELSSLAWLNSYSSKGMTRVDTLKEELKEIVEKNPGHLIASSACIGSEVGQNILDLVAAEATGDKILEQNAHNNIVNYILWCKDVFKDDFYIEVQPGTSREQIIVNKRLASVAKCFGVKMIPTSDTHYLKKEDRYVHKAFLNSENKEREVDAFYQDTYLHSNEEMIEKFKESDYSEDFVNEMFENTLEIYNKVENYSLAHAQQVPKVDVDYYPKKNPPEGLEKYNTLSEMYQSEDEINRYWINKCIDRLKEINKFNEVYLDELEEEAEVKKIIGEKLDTNMYAYPVCLAHYINLMWNCGSSIGVGRGSACSALNHYLLGITQLDSIEWNFPFFRYMNRDTDGLGDIDIDVCPSKVQKIISAIREERGQKFKKEIENPIFRENLGAVYVCTFGTESTKSAILTAARGYRSEEYPEGIDIDTAQYLSSLVPSERGFVWSIHDVVYGNEEKDRKPVKIFVNEIKQYPGLLEIIEGIEGCISRRGRHASGVLFMGEDPFEFNAFMKTPSGEIVTQYDLHDAEWAGSVKMDILVTEVQDKIVQTLKFLQRDGLLDQNLNLRELYNKYLHPDVLPLDKKEIWKVIQEASTLDLFQLDSDIGRQGAKKVKPSNINELSSVNGLIRLMTTEKGAESWLDKYTRFKNDRKEIVKEMDRYGLTLKEKIALNRYLEITYGIGISQEQLMKVLMDEDICNFSLKEANKARKVVSKKKMSEIPNLKQKVKETAKSENLFNYVWDYVVGPGLGYSFSDIHSLSYSFIGFQTAYLATNWNPIYWNTSCLIVNSGSLEEESDFEEDEDGEIIKKKEKSSDYGKIAKAIGDTRSRGIRVSLIDINKSSYSFEPDIENNEILFGMKALSNVGGPVIEQIISGRPYYGIADFMNRCPLNKSAMFSLIKGGAFDKLEIEWAKELNIEPRKLIMIYYISKVCEAKKRITLQNFNGLIQHNLIPAELDLQKKVYNFTKYLKANKKVGKYYVFDNICEDFYNKYFDEDQLEIINGLTCIQQIKWDKIYQDTMDKVRDWIRDNQEQILNDYNNILFKECWDKYAIGNISSCEMEALCFYYHKHELADVKVDKYGIVDFNTLSPESEVDYLFKRGGHDIPIYKINKIIGTVIGKNDTRSSITLLTTTGVVTVKFTKEYFAMYNRQMSEKQEDGTKKIVEKGWFTRGTKLLVAGYRRDDSFVAKTYKSNGFHQLYKIVKILDNGEIELVHDRAGSSEEE
jgi:DNA polymerase-3 subunit alpha